MYRRFHDRFGTAGVVIAVIALVAALGGTAIAAGGLTGKQKKEVTKIAKKYAGQDGAPGATGPAGLAGTNGTNGEKGAPGTNGTNGTNGSNGVSAEGVAFGPTEEPEGNPCAGLGGVEVTSASPEPSYVCNGEPGVIHPGETLPEGATETGSWAIVIPALKARYVGISFPIPLAADIAETNVHIVPVAGPVPSACDDGVAPAASAANPEAVAGHLCAFAASGPAPLGISKPGLAEEGAGVAGAGLSFFSTSEQVATGAFAVTAP